MAAHLKGRGLFYFVLQRVGVTMLLCYYAIQCVVIYYPLVCIVT